MNMNFETLTEREILELAKEALLMKWAAEAEKLEKASSPKPIAAYHEAVFWKQIKEVDAALHGMIDDTSEDEIIIESAASEATGKWEVMFHQALHSGVETRRRNMTADLKAGYNPHGRAIKMQEREITEYIHAYAEEVRRITEKTPRARESYCRSYLKVHGWIE